MQQKKVLLIETTAPFMDALEGIKQVTGVPKRRLVEDLIVEAANKHPQLKTLAKAAADSRAVKA